MLVLKRALFCVVAVVMYLLIHLDVIVCVCVSFVCVCYAQSLDETAPSFQRRVSCACLSALAEIEVAASDAPDTSLFVKYLRYAASATCLCVIMSVSMIMFACLSRCVFNMYVRPSVFISLRLYSAQFPRTLRLSAARALVRLSLFSGDTLLRLLDIAACDADWRCVPSLSFLCSFIFVDCVLISYINLLTISSPVFS